MDRLWLRIEQLERERDEARKQAEAYRDEIKYANVGWAFPWDATTPEEDDER